MELVTIPESTKGAWSIEHFTVDSVDFHSLIRGRGIPLGGKYTRLKRGCTVVMSDTPAEQRDHYEAVYRAYGSCLLNGLGIGMVLKNILIKPEVTDVTVVEISPEVIEMVGPHYPDKRVTIINADAFTYTPAKGKRFNMVWHDIWDYICADNLEEMAKLHRKYGRRADWQGSWCKAECLRNR